MEAAAEVYSPGPEGDLDQPLSHQQIGREMVGNYRRYHGRPDRERSLDCETIAEQQRPTDGREVDFQIRRRVFSAAGERSLLLYRSGREQRAVPRNGHSGI